MSATDDFIAAKDDFISQWGALGTSWGISRTMAQVHVLLMISPEPISTDQCMEELQISRGNAHTNLKELVGWGLVKIVVKKGERKEFFRGEKDIWKVTQRVIKSRQRNELTPMLEVLTQLSNAQIEDKAESTKQFKTQINAIKSFSELADRSLNKISGSEENWFLKTFMKFMK